MSAPRTKRQFAGAASDPAQRHITSFFRTSPSDSTSPSDPTTAPLSPVLPAQVQANLLSVGMRVRKSVPEGYKTGHSTGGFSLWADSPASSAAQPPSSVSSSSLPLPAAGAAAPDGLAAPSPGRELLPFCGIHKVGGLAVQPDTPTTRRPASFSPSSPVPDLDDLPSLTSSQQSVASTISEPPYYSYVQQAAPPSLLNTTTTTTTNTRKRAYADETAPHPSLPANEGGGTVWRARHDWRDDDGEISPRTLAPPPLAAGWERNARVMAVPRGARKASSIPAVEGPGGARLRDLEQENVFVRVAGGAVGRGGGGAGTVDDFDEADFLDYRMRDAGEMEVEFD